MRLFYNSLIRIECLLPFKRFGGLLRHRWGMDTKKAWRRACCSFPRLEAFALPVFVETKQRRGPRKYVQYAHPSIPQPVGYDACGYGYISLRHLPLLLL